MAALYIATAVVVLSHLVPMWPKARHSLVSTLGRRTYLTAHSTLSLAALAFLIWAWIATPLSPSPLAPEVAAKQAAVLLMPLAVTLVAGRLISRPGELPRGIYTVTSAPGSLGLAIWAALHLFAASDERATIVFAGFAAVALGALIKNAVTAPQAFRCVGWIPLLAVLAGRTKLDWRGLAAPLAAGIVAWVALLHFHPLLIGPDPRAYLIP